MPTVAQFLTERLHPLAKHVFGVPGDYILKLIHHLNEHLDVCNTTDEEAAGFAADAYARVNGFGVVCATHCVGSFKLLNPIAGAFAEKSPVLVLTGAPGIKERQAGLLLHHVPGGDYECQHQVFQNVTCASAILSDPSWAAHEIDRVIDAIRYYKQPGYIEIPRDMVDRNVKYDVYAQGTPALITGDKATLQEALDTTIEWLNRSQHPVIVAGAEMARFGFSDELTKFAEGNNIPIVATILGKSVVSELHRLYAGVYAGSLSTTEVRALVEESDCVLMLGAMLTDIDMSFQAMHYDRNNAVIANTSHVRVRRSTYEHVPFHVFVKSLLSYNGKPKTTPIPPKRDRGEFMPKNSRSITTERLFEKINSILDANMAVIADIGDSLFGAVELTVPEKNRFLSPAFYTSMGNAVPSALGVQLALPNVRPVVIVGDGAFQMTGTELSTIGKRKLNPIVFVLNNDGYLTERCLGLDGPYNDIQPWLYHKIVDVIGCGLGFLVKTEGDLESAVSQALENKKSPTIINVVVAKDDATVALRRMTSNLAQKL